MSKIAIFYMIGQYGDNWQNDFYYEQLNHVLSSGLYDQCEFIDVFVKGRTPLIDTLDKFNNISYLGDIEPETPSNKKLYRAYNYIQHRIWNFSQTNPDYKVLFFHSLGVSHTDPQIIKTKRAWREYLETLLIYYWRECVELLNYYDCVGSEYVSTARYSNQKDIIHAPHYQGFFWWANSSYIKKLNPNFVNQPVPWQPWLCELWIGSGNPKAYNFFHSGLNHYEQTINPPYDDIIKLCHSHLDILRNHEQL